jgi:thiol-disulfide isomerase/thioredoxin
MGLHQALMKSTLTIATGLLLALAGLVVSGTTMPLHVSADTAGRSDAPVLIYIYSPECGACRQFDREVGPIYDKTAESLALPLERVLIDDWQAYRHQLVECASAEVIGTPTFLQIRDCQELDRITGYSDAELFWLGHRRMMNRIKSDQ